MHVNGTALLSAPNAALCGMKDRTVPTQMLVIPSRLRVWQKGGTLTVWQKAE